MFIFLLVIFLPLIEIIGFIVIGGKIGVGLSLLWVMADVVIGVAILKTLGAKALQKVAASAETGALPAEEMAENMFDSFCIVVGALLLIFPGFISDFMALPLLIPPVRHLIFLFLKNKHGSILSEMNKTSRGFTYWYEERSDGAGMKTIEGDFRSIDPDKKEDDKKLR